MNKASYQSKTVLVVDDDDMNLKMAELILKKELGVNVILVDSGMKCIDTLQHEIVDLVLLDIQMPVVNGIKTLEMIRRREDLKNITVIFLTASSDKETVIKAGRRRRKKSRSGPAPPPAFRDFGSRYGLPGNLFRLAIGRPR